jgi:hypothetical protein
LLGWVLDTTVKVGVQLVSLASTSTTPVGSADMLSSLAFIVPTPARAGAANASVPTSSENSRTARARREDMRLPSMEFLMGPALLACTGLGSRVLRPPALDVR